MSAAPASGGTEPALPPLLTGARAPRPFEAAQERAREGAEAGLLLWDSGDALEAALVLVPEVPLADAMAMLPVAGIALQNALGALGPPELPVHLEWEGGVRVNGARCGEARLAVSGREPDAVPDWLVLGLAVPFRWGRDAPGETPSETVLLEEGCGELGPVALLEAWARHLMLWISRWTDEGPAPVHSEWTALSWEKGRTIELRGRVGTFLGLDERLGALVRGETTALVPLTELLDPT